MEIAYIAKRLARGERVKNVKALSGQHEEPTWGDLTKANLIAVGIGSSNEPTLTSAFGSGVMLLDLQMCRNASAHLNHDRIADVINAKVRYSNTKFTHPSDVMFWEVPSTRDYLWKSWIDEIDVIARSAVR